ncbi:hypothetical protein K503DRAFT_803796 [Rhizopogon vinicolor AM-OR11-026]|uniref:Uncharacterized protein n=1 Tax=Rhizopogon vinicolor AM-OR11-026 TaxID=1314800 RepID=A0A1B7MNJ9_9AGAM|nr:hypothetical protein K503DRAFT_803796 [Rhizopogon vinicolor AM-OR11-026]
MRKVILVVPEPGRIKTPLELQQGTHHDWILTALPHGELNYLMGIKHLNGLIFAAQPDKNHQVPTDHVMVHINELVRYPGPSDLRPCYMDFQTFSEIIFMSRENLQQAMKGFTAIWGGLDLTKNPYEAPVRFHNRSGSPRRAGDLHCTFPEYLLALRRLEKILPIWPGTAESRAASSDHNITTRLDAIAREVTQSHRPTTHLLEKKPPDHCTTSWILKCEASQSKNHTKILWDGGMPCNLEEGGCRWMVQHYVPEWARVGQWRCLMVDMAPFYIIHEPSQNPGSSSLTLPYCREDGWTLKELTCMLTSNPDQQDFMSREGGTREQIQAANDEIHRFLKQTLEIFIVAEEKELNNRGLKIRSSLRVSARVDLSITKNPETQELDYFVSGISRGPGMVLYGSSSARNIQRYGLEYANPFIK